MPDEEFDRRLAECERSALLDSDFEIPGYVYDVHTRRGKQRGKTRRILLRDEHDALTDPTTIFANFDQMLASESYVQPELNWGPQ